MRMLLPLLALALLTRPAAAAARLEGPVAARVLEVVDGDTLAVRATVWLDQEIVTRVRLDGVDTPESRSPCADEKRLAGQARARLTALVQGAMEGQGGTILLHNIVHDKYGGRVRAQVRLADGTDLAAVLIRDGVARAYRGGKRQPWCTNGIAAAANDEG